jgi:hypothetical protein
MCNPTDTKYPAFMDNAKETGPDIKALAFLKSDMKRFNPVVIP